MFFGNTKINNLTKHISINFTRSSISGGLIEPHELAGAIPAKNWNNIITDICNNFSSRYISQFMFDYWSNSNYYTSLQNPEYKTYYIHNGNNLYQNRFTQAIWGTQTHTIFTTNDYYYTSNQDNDVWSNPQNTSGAMTWGPEQLFHFQSRNASTSTFDIKIEYYRFGLYYTISEYIMSTDTTRSIEPRTLFNMTNTEDTYAKNFLFRLKIDFTTTTPKLTISKLVFWKSNGDEGNDITLVDDVYTAWQHKVFYPSELAGYKNWHIQTFRNNAGHLNMKFDYMVSTLPLDDTNLTGNITQNIISGIKPLNNNKGESLDTVLIATPGQKLSINENYYKDYDKTAHDNYISLYKSINDYYTSNTTLFKGYTECLGIIEISNIPLDFMVSTYNVRIYTTFEDSNTTRFYRLDEWYGNQYIGNYLRAVGSVDNSFVYPVINAYKKKNNESAQPIGVYDSNTGQISDNDPHVKTSISNSGFVGTDDIQWAAVINYANGNSYLYSNNNYALIKNLSGSRFQIMNSAPNNANVATGGRIGGIQITKNN